MRDERLRALERRWRASGAPEDEQEFLLARVRAGALSMVRVRYAAALGDAAAVRLGLGSLDPAPDPDQQAWSSGLDLLSASEARRFACDCAEHVQTVWSDARPSDGRPAAAIRVARRFADGAADLGELALARRGVDEAARHAGDALGSDHPAVFAARSAWAAAGDPERVDLAERAARQAAATGELPFAPGNPVHDWQRERLAGLLLGRGAAATSPDDERLPVYAPDFTFKVGQRLRHRRFGVGEVVHADARRIDVAFEGGEVRRLAQGR